MTLLMTVIAAAVGPAQTEPLPMLCSPAPSPATALWHWLLSVRVPDIAFSAACRGISKWQFSVFHFFRFSTCSTLLLPLPSPACLVCYNISQLQHWYFRFGCARARPSECRVSSSLAIFVGCICNRLIKMGQMGSRRREGGGKWISQVYP